MAKKDICLKTERLYIIPMTHDELRAQVDSETDENTKAIYAGKLKSCEEEPNYMLWFTPWKITLKDSGIAIGDVGFKGPHTKGSVEIGYYILPSQQKKGYMTEALAAMINWAFSQKDIYTVTAETAPNNRASQLVLEKNGFVMYANGKVGPRYKIEKKHSNNAFIIVPACVALGAIAGYFMNLVLQGAGVGALIGIIAGFVTDLSLSNRRKRVMENN